MCGIAGLWSSASAPPPREGELRAMVNSLHHRGPDGRGLHFDERIGLAHARLGMVDLRGGAQPICTEDRRVWVVCNGEIFNHRELRASLRRRGHVLRSESDCEVLVHLYEEQGERFVDALNGQFAIALWDGREQRLLLLRDRVGIRPLFYTWVGGRLAFASEIKALFTLPGVARRFDAEAMAACFSYWSPLPPRTVFEGVWQLPPGHLMSVRANGAVALRRYWDWSFPGCGAATDDERVEELRGLLLDAVRLQLRADVPTGTYLSGGLDSSIVTALVARQRAAPVRSFSLTFEDSEFDESGHQRVLADFVGADHSALRATRARIAAAFPRLVWHAETPLVRTAAVPMMLLADRVRAAGCKAVLTGEGADEAFGGYDLFKEAALRRFVARAAGSHRRAALFTRLYPYLAHSPASAGALAQRSFAATTGRPDAAGFAHATRMQVTRRALGFFHPEWRERLLRWDADAALEALMPPAFGRWCPLERDQYVEAQTLLPGYLLAAQGDRAAMAASIETRHPFLDHRVIEFACRLPPRLKLRGLQEKVLLKRAFAADLPRAIGRRTKQPYRAPDSACFFECGKARPWVEELLSPRALALAGLFDAAAVGKLVGKCAAGRAIGFADNMAFVGVLSTMLLHRQYIAGTGAPPPVVA